MNQLLYNPSLNKNVSVERERLLMPLHQPRNRERRALFLLHYCVKLQHSQLLERNVSGERLHLLLRHQLRSRERGVNLVCIVLINKKQFFTEIVCYSRCQVIIW